MGAAGPFDLVTTYDVLHDAPKPEQLVEEAAAALAPGGVFLLTSCNNTAEELVRHFTSPNAAAWGGDGASPLAELDRVRYPTFQFGGVVGAGVATVAFRRTV